MDSAYEPKKYEKEIYQRWEASGVFAPRLRQVDDALKLWRRSGFGGQADKNKEKFVVAIPPPNVTGSLHMGHALNNTIQDILIRYYRMKGRKTLWIPGTDHAGIATQFKVEQKLAKEGIRRFDLGREKFIEKVWEWKDQFEITILNQLKTLGFSCDWSRKRFTMDEGYSEAVATAFKKYWDKGYLYRGKRVVNWCPRCHTSLSDLELEYKEEKAKLYWIKYGPFILATTRPETKLGDTAVAVNPKDKRYQEMVGKKYKIPGVLGEFEVVVVTDPSVDIEFGSGAVKVTPAHDAADAEIALRHHLPTKQIIDENGRMMDNCGKYAGLKTSQAREEIVKDMTVMGLIDHIDENYLHNNAHCYRCGSIIEPIPSTQWFVKMDKLAGLAAEAVKSKKIRIIPERYETLYLNWLSKIKDWCISRQLWWGHRLPVWFKKFEQPVEITYFVHGTTFDNEKECASGHSSVGLSEKGKKESLTLKGIIKNEKFDAVFCSDLPRATETVEIVFSGQKIIKDQRLRECNYGKLNGQSIKKFKSKEFYIENQHPGGESGKDVEQRIKDFLLEISEKYQGKKIAILAHAYTQLAIEVLLNNKTWEEAIKTDWRNTKEYQPGWQYQLKELVEVGKEKPGEGWQQSEDTLDTWFSSALWPFATLGWPGANAKIKNKKDKIKNWDLKIYGQDIFNGLVNGTKKIEIRAGKPEGSEKYWDDFKIGDVINFSLADEKTDKVIKSTSLVKKSIKKINHYKNFEELFKNYKAEDDYPGKSSEQLKEWWGKRPKLSERIKKYGLWVFELENDHSQDLENFYPTEFLSTAQDILYLWVARMVFSSLEFTGQIPFKKVYIHPTVLALSGKRMSKSLGTGIDPLELVEKYGADATRMGIMYQINREQQSFKFDERAVLSSRNFVNKIWNISRFVEMTTIQNPKSKIQISNEIQNQKFKTETIFDKWILSRLNTIIVLTSEKIETYQFGEAARELYDFVWHEFADWYLEISKLQSSNIKTQDSTASILHNSLFIILKLSHPFIPFVTEQIWQELTNNESGIRNNDLLMIQPWPRANKNMINKKAEQKFEKIKNLVIEIRNFRTAKKIQPKDIIEYQIKKSEKIFSENQEIIEKLGRVKLIL